MTKLTYLELTNHILVYLAQPKITDVTNVSGHAEAVINLINDAQQMLFNVDDSNWYSLYTYRSVSTVINTRTIAVASDFGRSIDLVDTTNNCVLVENSMRRLDYLDANRNLSGTPMSFAFDGVNYVLDRDPSGVYVYTDRYWKEPTKLTINTSISDLPKECENLILFWVWSHMLDSRFRDFELSNRKMFEFERRLKGIKTMNNKKIPILRVKQFYNHGIQKPIYPHNY